MRPEWVGYFSTLATVSITAFALMFAAMQIRYREWNGSPLKKVVAISALIELLVPVTTSMVFLMVGHPWRAAVVLGGALGLSTVGTHWWIILRNHKLADDFDWAQLRLSFTSFTVYALLLASSIGMNQYLIPSLCLWLLVSGCFESWYVLDPKGMRKSNKEEN